MLAVVGLAAGVIDGQRTGDVGGSAARMLGAALSALPAVWVCVAVAVLLVGLVPRLTGLAWGVLIGFLVLGEFGVIMGLPSWLTSVSPFDHLSQLPEAASRWLPSSVLPSSPRASPQWVSRD